MDGDGGDAWYFMMAASSSSEETFSPRRRMESFLRSTKWKKPSSSRRAMSPVWCHRFRNTSTGACGLFQ